MTLDEVAAPPPDLVLAPSEPYPFGERHVAELRRVAPVECWSTARTCSGGACARRPPVSGCYPASNVAPAEAAPSSPRRDRAAFATARRTRPIRRP